MSWCGLETHRLSLTSHHRLSLFTYHTQIFWLMIVVKEEIFLTLSDIFLLYLSFQPERRREQRVVLKLKSWIRTVVVVVGRPEWDSAVCAQWSVKLKIIKIKLRIVTTRKACTWRSKSRWILSYRFYTINCRAGEWTSSARSWRKLWRISSRATGILTSHLKWVTGHRLKTVWNIRISSFLWFHIFTFS